VPLNSISYLAPCAAADEDVAMPAQLEWSLCESGPVLSSEIVTRYVLPCISPQELFATVQVLSVAHSKVLESEVCTSQLNENLLLCISDAKAWLVDRDFKIHCRIRLPFDAIFAHAVYAPDLSAAIVATKFWQSSCHLWAIVVGRRRRSLRFQLVCSPLEEQTMSPEQMVLKNQSKLIGMSTLPGGQMFALTAMRRLSCYKLSVGIESTDWKLVNAANQKAIQSDID